jgi:glycosyltransferase involved in cell wall biosynthesis
MRPERFGLTIVESMACGTPVIAFDKGSPKELIKNGETGFVVETIGEAASAIKNVPHISPRRCRDHVAEKFSIEKMVEGYLQVYKNILSQSR